MVECPAEDILGAFISGHLDSDHSAEVERHIADCEGCAAVVAMAALGDAEDSLDERIVRNSKLGRYHILGVAGTGAVGRVYAAYDPQLDRKVALKMLRR